MDATLPETVELLGISKTTLYRLVKEGQLEKFVTYYDRKTYLKLDKKVGGQYLAAYINTICKWYDGAPCKIDFTPQKFIEEFRRNNSSGRNRRKSELTG